MKVNYRTNSSANGLFDSITNKFQLRFKNREFAADSGRHHRRFPKKDKIRQEKRSHSHIKVIFVLKSSKKVKRL